MIRLGIGALLLISFLFVTGCNSGGPTDSAQQELSKDYSPENVAKEYEKKGMTKEAAEVRGSVKQDQGGADGR